MWIYQWIVNKLAQRKKRALMRSAAKKQGFKYK